MPTYLIRPCAPLIFRSGKPFGAGSRDGANFPWPSSLAGALRTAWWEQHLCHEAPNLLLQHTVAGPWLAFHQGKSVTPLVPKPADAIYLNDEHNNTDTPRLYRLKPKALSDGIGTNLPKGLLPMTLTEKNKGKSQAGPKFWSLDHLLRWQREEKISFAEVSHDGLTTPLSDERTHLAINDTTGSAEEGKLFQTQGLIFGQTSDTSSHSELALLALYDQELTNGLITMGGERRLSWLEKTKTDVLTSNNRHIETLRSAHGLVLHLVTPALFDGGWSPGWLNEEGIGSPPGLEELLSLQLVATCLERWEPFSGWDLVAKGPRPSRKLAPAGSSYWFNILEQSPHAMEKLWLTSICDQDQDRRNGFGLVIPGPYLD